jgi:hypothetical protein
MRELEVFRVFIATENRNSWERYFAGRPTRDAVILALENDHQDTIEDWKPGQLSSRFTNLLVVVKSMELPDNYGVATYAGVKVGEIKVEHAKPVLLLEEVDE